MEINIPKDNCIHLTDMSCYNHNYYRLPFAINGCDVLYESYDGGENFNGNSIGILIGNEYQVKFWLHTDDNHNEKFMFDSQSIGKENRWT